MTTEQMDWVDDTQPGRHKPDMRTTTEKEADDNARRARLELGFRGDRDSIPDDERFDEVPEQPRIRAMDEKEPSPDVMGAVYAAFERAGIPDYTARMVVKEIRASGIAFERYGQVPELVVDAFTTRGSRISDTLASYVGTPVAAYNLGWQEARDAMQHSGWRDSIPDDEKSESVTTMAEEPIEHRLRRTWLNGYTGGFREGMERAAYIGQEWDHG